MCKCGHSRALSESDTNFIINFKYTYNKNNVQTQHIPRVIFVLCVIVVAKTYKHSHTHLRITANKFCNEFWFHLQGNMLSLRFMLILCILSMSKNVFDIITGLLKEESHGHRKKHNNN